MCRDQTYLRVGFNVKRFSNLCISAICEVFGKFARSIGRKDILNLPNWYYSDCLPYFSVSVGTIFSLQLNFSQNWPRGKKVFYIQKILSRKEVRLKLESKKMFRNV